MNNLIKNLGGRKCSMFILTLFASVLLAIFNKANTEILGLIDTLYLVYAGANVSAKKKENKKNEQ
tara:strand:+ start:24568 stop:24762 length:195 start_codon:yes stop_codon:yes gene_type:complete